MRRMRAHPRGWKRLTLASALLFALNACSDSTAQPAAQQRLTENRASHPQTSRTLALVVAARKQIGVTVSYDPAYTRIAYPNGDVPSARGVCTDVVIRALRTQGIDLQQRVHEDMRAHFADYPQKWGLRGPDSNIDHRRVPNLQTWFSREGWSVAVTDRAADYRAGDLVTWTLPGNLPHIGIVSDRKSLLGGTPLVVHNIGRGTREDDILFDYPITGHYRAALSNPAASPR